MFELHEYLKEIPLGPDVQLLAASIAGSGNRPLVKVVVDTAKGISIDELTSVTRLLRADDDIARQLGTAGFLLEVTSPGVERGLTEPWQFPRHLGQMLSLTIAATNDQTESEERIDGRLASLSAEGPTLGTSEGKRQIGWEKIRHAKVKLAW